MPVISTLLSSCPSECSSRGACLVDTSPFCSCDAGYDGVDCSLEVGSTSPPSAGCEYGFFEWLPWMLLFFIFIFFVVSQLRGFIRSRRRREVATQTPRPSPSAPFE
ncbi:unnamed protein product [Caenorhabditis nigoni]